MVCKSSSDREVLLFKKVSTPPYCSRNNFKNAIITSCLKPISILTRNGVLDPTYFELNIFSAADLSAAKMGSRDSLLIIISRTGSRPTLVTS